MNVARIERVMELIDVANANDPAVEISEGHEYPKALLYGRRMSACLERVSPDASEALRIAARGQHIRRWEVPRDRYPESREGYLKWRTGLYGFHAERVAELMSEVGYDASAIDRVKSLVQKRGIKTDPEAQTLEDIICLVFLEYYFADFAASKDTDKLIGIVQKTWSKMSEHGHALALELPLPDSIRALLARALGVS